MRSWLTYTAARLALFAGAFGVVYLFGARSWIALILAWVISGLASYVLLSKWRDQMSATVVDWSNKREEQDKAVGSRLVGGSAREDEIQEELLRAQEAEAKADAEAELNGEKPVGKTAEPAERAGEDAPGAEGTKK